MLRGFLLGATVLLVLSALSVGWLLRSEQGARFLLHRIGAGQGLSYGTLRGDLWHGLTLQEARWRTDTLTWSAQALVLKVRLGWRDQSLRIRQLDIKTLHVDSTAGGAARKPNLESWSRSLPLPAAPVPIHLEQLRITGGSWQGPAQTLQAPHALLLGNGVWHGTRVELQLHAEAPGLEIKLVGDVGQQGPGSALELEARLAGHQWHGQLPKAMQLQMEWLDFQPQISLRLRTSEPALEVIGTVEELMQEPQLKLSVVGDSVTLPGWPDALFSSLEGRLHGALLAPEFSLAGNLVMPDQPPIPVTSEGQFDQDALELSRLVADLPSGAVTARGRYPWAERDELWADLDWEALRWPLLGEPLLESPTGNARLRGTMDAWVLESALDLLAAEDLPVGAELRGHGGRSRAQFTLDSLSLLAGRVEGTVDLDWRHELTGQAQFTAQGMEPGRYWPDWPGRLSGKADLSWQDGVLAIEFQQWSGTLRGESLRLEGGLQKGLEGWSAQALALDAGSASFWVDGRLGAQLSLRVHALAPGWFQDWLGGAVVGQLQWQGQDPQPLSFIDLELEQFSLGELSLATASVRGGARIGSETSLTLAASELTLGDRELGALRGQVTGRPEQHRLELALTEAPFTGTLALTGQLDLAAPELSWEGQLSTLEAAQNGQPLGALRKPAALRLDKAKLQLQALCLDLRPSGSLCFDGALSQERLYGAEARLDAIPLVVFQHWINADLELSQDLSGTLDWRWPEGSAPSGQFELTLSEGQVAGLTPTGRALRTGVGFWSGQLNAKGEASSSLSLDLADHGRASANITLSDALNYRQAQIRGEAQLALDDLGTLRGLLTNLDLLEGRLALQLAIAGTGSEPELRGDLQLAEAAMDIPILGSQLRSVNLDGRLRGPQRLQFEGDFALGAGSGRLVGDMQVPALDDWQLHALLTGEDLALIRLQDLRLDMDSALQLALTPRALELSGALHVPRATLAPVASLLDRQTESPDLVRMDEIAPGEQVDAVFRTTGRVGLSLGDAVWLDTSGARLQLEGGISMDWRGAPVPRATGVVLTQGELSAWGPSLSVRNGLLRWTDSPLDDPVLDLRAERDVFGNTEIRAAGISIAGSVEQLTIEPYTRPLTSRERAWALLLTGSDINLGQGIGAFDVGSYIAPGVFLSYGISLFDSENVVGLRYDLSRNWGVKATSSQRASGVDLSYTIED